MNVPAPAPVMTVNDLHRKIGILAVSNEFLSNEVERLNAWIVAFNKDLQVEVAKIETEAEIEEKTVSDKVKAAIARVKAKL